MARVRTGLILAGAALAFAAAAPSSRALSFSQVQRGKYLVDAGDCVACHTREHGQPFAGGRGIETPFGVIYSSNLTADTDTGIGSWSDRDFYRALHYGIAPGGRHLYPAFPYPYFTKLSRDDVQAIRAYLRTLPAVRYTPPPNRLAWPMSHRALMRAWNLLYFTPGAFRPNPRKTAEWNRGAYLVEGPGHCGACHTPKNALGADESSHALAGGRFQNWFAPEIAGSVRRGLGGWSVADIVEYLKTGRNRHSGATGPMAEAVQNSTSKLSWEDLRAIAVYLKSQAVDESAPGGSGETAQFKAGRAIYADSCSACHQAAGQGVARLFPPLKGSAVAQQHDPTTMIRLILEGARTAPTAARPSPTTMPSFDWKLTDDEVAAVATYVRNAWGNRGGAADAGDVEALRKSLHLQAARR